MADSPDTTTSLLRALRELDAGIEAHTLWLKSLHRSLVCGTPPCPDDIADDAYRLCYFGQWYYSPHRVKLEYWSDSMKSIEVLHQDMHQRAHDLLVKRCKEGVLEPEDYDSFMDLGIRFKTEVRSLQFRIINQVCLVDHMTGAWNRNSMFQQLTEEHERMVRNGQPCCICMVDLDHFKDVNDAYGHPSGDDVLHAAVDVISASLRKYDTIFRYGGEEFLLCLPNISVADASLALDRIRQAVAAHEFKLRQGKTINVTASFGVAAMSAELSIEENIEVADRALLCAKANGRNRVCSWDINCPGQHT
jgi:diguanylate cyclase